jgi:T-complex protein 1 subunit theta
MNVCTNNNVSATEPPQGVVRMTKAEQLLEFSNTEEKFIERIVGEILDSGVNVLVSGGPIGEMAMHYIEKRGVMVIKVLRCTGRSA